MNPPPVLAPVRPTKNGEVLPAPAEIVKPNFSPRFDEPYNNIIRDNLDLLSDTIPGSLLETEAVDLYKVMEHGRSVYHPVVHFKAEADIRGKFHEVKLDASEDRTFTPHEIGLIVIRTKPIQHGESRPLVIRGKHEIADMPNLFAAFGNLALSNIASTVNRFNGDAGNRHPTTLV